MLNTSLKALMAGVAVAVPMALAAGNAQAASCTNIDGNTSAVTVTAVDGIIQTPSIESTACQGTSDNTGASDGDVVLDGLNDGTYFGGFFDAGTTWSLVGKVDADDGAVGDVDVSVSGYDPTGTWEADFSPYGVNNLVVALKGGKEGAALFLFQDILKGSVFAGTFDMGLAGLVNDKDKGQDISNLVVAGLYISDDPGDFDVPVPASLPLLAAGLGLFGAISRRKARKSA